jgi:hypothetical protein
MDASSTAVAEHTNPADGDGRCPPDAVHKPSPTTGARPRVVEKAREWETDDRLCQLRTIY